MNDRITAIHEAGHAVMSCLLGLPPALVSVRAQPGTVGHMDYGREARRIAQDGVDDVDVLRRLAMVALAGPVTESMHVHGTRWSLRNLDAEGIRTSGGTVDLQNVFTFAELASDDTDRVVYLLRLWRLQTAAKLGRHWDAAEALALELERHGSLTGREVETVLTAGGHLRRRAVDADKVLVSVRGRPLSLRAWAREVDRCGGHRFAPRCRKGELTCSHLRTPSLLRKPSGSRTGLGLRSPWTTSPGSAVAWPKRSRR